MGEQNHLKNKENKKEIGEQILEWGRQHKDIIMNCPYNKITTTLYPMFEELHITDIRNVFICFDVHGRKEFLTYLKEHI